MFYTFKSDIINCCHHFELLESNSVFLLLQISSRVLQTLISKDILLYLTKIVNDIFLLLNVAALTRSEFCQVSLAWIV